MNRIFLSVILLCALALSAFSQSDDDPINVDSSLVVLNAAISDAKGDAVRGLKQKDFRVLEDGAEQQITFFQAEETPFAAVILIDSSGSMETRMSIARSAAINFLDGLRPDDKTAIYNFDSKVALVQDFSNSRDITENIFDLKPQGWTVMNDAIHQAAVLLGSRAEKRRAIVVLSDGEDTRSRYSADKALKAALAVNATIYTVDMAGIESGGRQRMQNQSVLKKLADRTGGRFVNAAGGAALRNAFKAIVDELGVQYTVAYQPSNQKNDGKWRELELRVARPGLTIRTRKGYNAPKD